ncbi:MAG: DUF5011 domain-containing protein [Candidatus Scalindua sp.]|nr:DUF5011 domain-containing protein [Candidatus Scalindua sp.]
MATTVARVVNVVDTTAPAITLLGNDPETVEFGTSYTDAGATASDGYDGVLTSSIVTLSSVDTATLGSYTVTYNVTDSSGNVAAEVTRTVDVVDTTLPVITMSGSSPVTVEAGSTYTDAGATASDNVDGVLTSSIVTLNSVDTAALGSYTVTYNVTDSSGNVAAEVTRTVDVVDTTLPIITMSGSSPVTVEIGSSYTDAGATASDNVDGVLTSSIVTLSSVDTAALGSYTVTYNVTDSSGNVATTVSRVVNVVANTAPVLNTIPDITVFVGEVVSFNPTATDAEADILTYSYSGWMMSDTYVTVSGDAGSYIVTVMVSDGILTDSQNVTVTVNDSSQPTLSWNANIETDLAGYKVYYGNTSGSYATNVDVGNQTSYTLSGLVGGQTYYIAITAYDSTGNESPFSSEVIYNVPIANDFDGDGVADIQDAFPTDPNEWLDTDSDGIGNNTDTDDDNDGMSDTWEIANGLDPLDDGSVDINNGADGNIDGDGFTNMQEFITGTIGNVAPVLNAIADITTNEGATITISPTATDPNGDTLTYTYTGWMTSNSYTTDYSDAGAQVVTVTVSDGNLTDSQDVTITVLNTNRPPVLDPIIQ